MNNVFENISKGTYEIYNEINALVGYAFVINFVDKIKEDSIRPFLIVNKEILTNNESLYVLFDSTNNDKKEKHRVNFSKELIPNFEIEGTDSLALPLAQTLNELNANKITIELNGLPDSLIPNDETINSLNQINEFTWFSFDEYLKQKVCHQQKNMTLLNNNFETYFKTTESYIGSPIFIVNVGAFASGNSWNVGTRILLCGYFNSQNNGYLKLQSIKKLAESIKKKFNFE